MKARNNLKNNTLTTIVAAAALLTTLSAPAQIISVNITEFATDVQQIDGSETFGIASLGTVVGGWNNLYRPLSATNLMFSDGSPSTLSLASTAPNAWATFNAAYANTPLLGGLDDYTTTVNPTSVTLNGLAANFPYGYFAIVYVGGFNGNLGASISDGTSTFYYRPLPSPSAPITFVQTTQTSDLGSGNNPIAQYAVFGSTASPLTANSITFTLDTQYGGGSGLGGVQIVAVPEPTAAALLLGGMALICVARRRLV